MHPNRRKKTIDNKVDELFDVPCVRQGGRRRIILGSRKTYRTAINCQMGQQCSCKEKYSCQTLKKDSQKTIVKSNQDFLLTPQKYTKHLNFSFDGNGIPLFSWFSEDD